MQFEQKIQESLNSKSKHHEGKHREQDQTKLSHTELHRIGSMSDQTGQTVYSEREEEQRKGASEIIKTFEDHTEQFARPEVKLEHHTWAGKDLKEPHTANAILQDVGEDDDVEKSASSGSLTEIEKTNVVEVIKDFDQKASDKAPPVQLEHKPFQQSRQIKANGELNEDSTLRESDKSEVAVGNSEIDLTGHTSEKVTAYEAQLKANESSKSREQAERENADNRAASQDSNEQIAVSDRVVLGQKEQPEQQEQQEKNEQQEQPEQQEQHEQQDHKSQASNQDLAPHIQELTDEKQEQQKQEEDQESQAEWQKRQEQESNVDELLTEKHEQGQDLYAEKSQQQRSEFENQNQEEESHELKPKQQEQGYHTQESQAENQNEETQEEEKEYPVEESQTQKQDQAEHEQEQQEQNTQASNQEQAFHMKELKAEKQKGEEESQTEMQDHQQGSQVEQLLAEEQLENNNHAEKLQQQKSETENQDQEDQESYAEDSHTDNQGQQEQGTHVEQFQDQNQKQKVQGFYEEEEVQVEKQEHDEESQEQIQKQQQQEQESHDDEKQIREKEPQVENQNSDQERDHNSRRAHTSTEQAFNHDQEKHGVREDQMQGGQSINIKGARGDPTSDEEAEAQLTNEVETKQVTGENQDEKMPETNEKGVQQSPVQGEEQEIQANKYKDAEQSSKDDVSREVNSRRHSETQNISEVGERLDKISDEEQTRRISIETKEEPQGAFDMNDQDEIKNRENKNTEQNAVSSEQNLGSQNLIEGSIEKQAQESQQETLLDNQEGVENDPNTSEPQHQPQEKQDLNQSISNPVEDATVQSTKQEEDRQEQTEQQEVTSQRQEKQETTTVSENQQEEQESNQEETSSVAINHEIGTQDTKRKSLREQEQQELQTEEQSELKSANNLEKDTKDSIELQQSLEESQQPEDKVSENQEQTLVEQKTAIEGEEQSIAQHEMRGNAQISEDQQTQNNRQQEQVQGIEKHVLQANDHGGECSDQDQDPNESQEQQNLDRSEALKEKVSRQETPEQGLDSSEYQQVKEQEDEEKQQSKVTEDRVQNSSKSKIEEEEKTDTNQKTTDQEQELDDKPETTHLDEQPDTGIEQHDVQAAQAKNQDSNSIDGAQVFQNQEEHAIRQEHEGQNHQEYSNISKAGENEGLESENKQDLFSTNEENQVMNNQAEIEGSKEEFEKPIEQLEQSTNSEATQQQLEEANDKESRQENALYSPDVKEVQTAANESSLQAVDERNRTDKGQEPGSQNNLPKNQDGVKGSGQGESVQQEQKESQAFENATIATNNQEAAISQSSLHEDQSSNHLITEKAQEEGRNNDGQFAKQASSSKNFVNEEREMEEGTYSFQSGHQNSSQPDSNLTTATFNHDKTMSKESTKKSQLPEKTETDGDTTSLQKTHHYNAEYLAEKQHLNYQGAVEEKRVRDHPKTIVNSDTKNRQEQEQQQQAMPTLTPAAKTQDASVRSEVSQEANSTDPLSKKITNSLKNTTTTDSNSSVNPNSSNSTPTDSTVREECTEPNVNAHTHKANTSTSAVEKTGQTTIKNEAQTQVKEGGKVSTASTTNSLQISDVKEFPNDDGRTKSQCCCTIF